MTATQIHSRKFGLAFTLILIAVLPAETKNSERQRASPIKKLLKSAAYACPSA